MWKRCVLNLIMVAITAVGVARAGDCDCKPNELQPPGNSLPQSFHDCWNTYKSDLFIACLHYESWCSHCAGDPECELEAALQYERDRIDAYFKYLRCLLTAYEEWDQVVDDPILFPPPPIPDDYSPEFEPCLAAFYIAFWDATNDYLQALALCGGDPVCEAEARDAYLEALDLAGQIAEACLSAL